MQHATLCIDILALISLRHASVQDFFCRGSKLQVPKLFTNVASGITDLLLKLAL